MVKNTFLSLVCVAAILSLSACGSNRTDRVASGAAVGAGAGALGGAVIGGLGVGTGALIGAGVGAAAGGLTDSDDINLGTPVWRR